METFRIGLIPLTWRDGLDVLFLTLLLYVVLRWFYRVNLLGVSLALLGLLVLLKGLSLMGLVAVSFLVRQLLIWIGVILAVALAPDLRRLLYGVRFFSGLRFLRRDVLTEQQAEHLAEEIIEALQLLSKNGLGALIVLEGTDDLSVFAQTGDSLQMPVAARMFMMLFEKKSPLHDGAVIVRGDKIIAARCTLPLSERLDLPQNYGQRHRAAMGITEQTDALTLIVSEETGIISIAQRGEIRRIPFVELKKLLIRFYLR
ncbi:MAG: DNA integrity scanning protein DisA nucleotide-binding domain protein [Bacteroidia bacterium]|nr:DNA integrity scanning protein DisA nucleotide-binding domain protein [Bacteroidia bacterium]